MKPGGNYFSVSVDLGLLGYQKKKKRNPAGVYLLNRINV